jgi:hypothetical protein
MPDIEIKYGAPLVIDGAVPADIHDRLCHAAARIPWRYGWKAPGLETSRYWHHEIGFGEKPNTEDVSAKVREHPVVAFADYMDWLLEVMAPKGTKLLRFYLNAHTFGTDGHPHTDTDRGEEMTYVLFLNRIWKPEWAGETVVFDERGEISLSVLPANNRIVAFPSDLLHAPRPLSRGFLGLRVVLVAKLAPPGGKGGAFNRVVKIEG